MPSRVNDNPVVHRWLITAGVLALAVAALDYAAARPSRDALVQPGRGIGKVKLGMTQAQVRRTLGAHRSVARRRELGFGQRYVELQWGHGEWSVGFQGRAGRMQAVRIGTTLRSQRTRSNLGTGSRIRDILRVYPGATCSDWAGLGTNSSNERWIVIRHPTGARTIFAAVWDGQADPGPVRVVEVMVQVPASGLSERRSRCDANWRRS
jgi:hypothetical protein